VPLAADLTNSTSGAELAVNTADKRLFTKDSGGTVVELGTNPSSLTLTGGTANGVPYLNGSKVLTTGSALTFDGTTFKVTGSGQLMAVQSTGDYSSSGSGFIRFKDSTGNRGYFGFGGTSNLMTVSNTVSSAAINFELTGSEQMRLTSTGLGIGTSSPSAKLHVSGDALADTFKLIANTTVSGSDATIFRPADNTLAFSTNGSERARIDSSGNLLVGMNSVSAAQNGCLMQPNGSTGVNHVAGTASGVYFSGFYYNNSAIGSITQNGTTGVSYNTASDYRLKQDIQPMTGALAKVAALKPCTYKWKADGSDGEGFIAHELAEVVPACVTGEKDAVDADGNPVYQGIDTSFLVATLTAAIQELKAEFDAYKASHP
jgi:hypothetical protein